MNNGNVKEFKIQMNLFTKQKHSQTWRMNLWLPGGKGAGMGRRDRLGVWD